MKQLFILLCVAVIVCMYTAPSRAYAFSECHDQRKGNCVRLDAPDSSPVTQKRSFSLFAATGVPFPGLEFLSGYGVTYDKDIGVLLSALYNFGVAIAGISALIIFTYAGLRRLTAADNPGAISDARTRMWNAAFGLAIVITSYLILYIINPDFTIMLSNDVIPALSP